MLAIRRPLIVQHLGSTLLPSTHQLPMQAMRPRSSHRLCSSSGGSGGGGSPVPCHALPPAPGAAQHAKHGTRSGLPTLWPRRALLASSVALSTGKQPGASLSMHAFKHSLTALHAVCVYTYIT